MPLMYILFGRLIGTFTNFFKQGADETQVEFLEGVNETVQVQLSNSGRGMYSAIVANKRKTPNCVRFCSQVGLDIPLKRT